MVAPCEDALLAAVGLWRRRAMVAESRIISLRRGSSGIVIAGGVALPHKSALSPVVRLALLGGFGSRATSGSPHSAKLWRRDARESGAAHLHLASEREKPHTFRDSQKVSASGPLRSFELEDARGRVERTRLWHSKGGGDRYGGALELVNETLLDGARLSQSWQAESLDVALDITARGHQKARHSLRDLPCFLTPLFRCLAFRFGLSVPPFVVPPRSLSLSCVCLFSRGPSSWLVLSLWFSSLCSLVDGVGRLGVHAPLLKWGCLPAPTLRVEARAGGSSAASQAPRPPRPLVVSAHAPRC